MRMVPIMSWRTLSLKKETAKGWVTAVSLNHAYGGKEQKRKREQNEKGAPASLLGVFVGHLNG